MTHINRIVPYVRPFHYYSRYPNQQGNGLGNLLSAPLRFALPLIKQAFRFVRPLMKKGVKRLTPVVKREIKKIKPIAVREATKLGENIAKDVISGKLPIKASMKRRAPESVNSLLQSYTREGRKKEKKVTTSNKNKRQEKGKSYRRKVKRDIFN